MEKNRSIKKNDLILVAIVIVAAVIMFLSHSVFGNKGISNITVKVDGEVKGTYSLLENQEIEINDGSNILLIKDGEADMVDADCPDGLCVKQKSISKNKESIICLPNKVVVEVEAAEESEFDAVTN